MGFRRLLWWLNGQSLDTAIRDLRVETERMQQVREKMAAQSEEFQRESALLHQIISDDFPRAKLWEANKIDNMSINRPAASSPLQVTLSDPLCHWLWKQAWNACAETGNWDLLTAAAGIARGMREEGVPLSAGLKASAVPYQPQPSGSE